MSSKARMTTPSQPAKSVRDHTTPSRKQSNIYFAYGSNLHLEQMAKRCPKSRFLGRATLHGYRWQINQRGFANVVKHRGKRVEGICYLLDALDEARLDRNEGVHTGAYEKGELEVELYATPVRLVGRDVMEIVLDRRLERIRREGRAAASRAGASNRRASSVPACGGVATRWLGPGGAQESERRPLGEMTKALVYMSTTFIVDGQPRNEYVDRMRSGLSDARVLGMSQQYEKESVSPFLNPSIVNSERRRETLATGKQVPANKVRIVSRLT